MFITMPRSKKRDLLLSVNYRIVAALRRVVSTRTLLRLLLDLEWQFSRLAHEQAGRFYNENTHPLLRESIKFIATKVSGDTRALDLGSSHGEISHQIALIAREVVGVELDQNCVEAAQAAYRRDNLRFVHGDAIEYVKSASEKFDALILSHVLEHIDDPESFLRDVANLCPLVYIEVPDFEASFHNEARVDVGSKFVYTDPDHVIEFDRVELARMISAAGLEIRSSHFTLGVLRVWCGPASRG